MNNDAMPRTVLLVDDDPYIPVARPSKYMRSAVFSTISKRWQPAWPAGRAICATLPPRSATNSKPRSRGFAGGSNCYKITARA